MEQHLNSTVNMASSPTPDPSKIGVAVAPATQDVTSEASRDSASSKTVNLHQLPIPPASEPMQYRAIGLIQGTYIPSEEQFTRGMLMTEDNQTIDAVLLGRVMSLVKKHVDLTIPHLWVVYPRTRPKDEHLHAQIVGIWEPDNLNRNGNTPSSDQEEQEAIASDSDLPQDDESKALVSEPEAGATDTTDTVDGTESVGADQEEKEASEAAVGKVTDDSKAVDDVPATTAEKTTAEKTTVEKATAEKTTAEKTTAEKTTAGKTTAESDSAVETQTSPKTIRLVKPSRPRISAKAAQLDNKTEKLPPSPTKTVPTSATQAVSAVPDMTDGYFSIRGEVIQFSPEDEQITVRIKQASRKNVAKAGEKKKGSDSKEFKLQLKGCLDGRVVGYFWDLHAQREGNDLVVTDSTMIKLVPPKKNRRKKPFGGRGGGRGGPRRRDGGGRGDSYPARSGDRPSPSAPTRRGPAAKPVLKKNAAKESDTPTAES